MAKKLSVQQIASTIAKREGHRSQARIGDIREILSIIADLSYECPDTIRIIVSLGISRAKRKSNAKKT